MAMHRCGFPGDETRGKRPRWGIGTARKPQNKTEHAELCPTCPEGMIAGLRVLLGGIPHASNGAAARSLAWPFICNQTYRPAVTSPHAFAPWDISFFGPKNKTCIFTGRSSDSVSSPRPLLGINTNGLWPRLHFTAAVLSETCTPFPILPPARMVPARRRSGTCEYPCILLCLKYSICLWVLQYPLSRRERGCAVHHAAQPLPETWELFH